ncbi:MAG: Flp pilus assembly protein CpaB [Bradymonadaceae bacterium]|nr:Flp pilus assembly protein CpaB [Lujinxingiaceae bacterium]
MAKKKLLIAAVLVGAFAALLLYLYASQLDDEKQALLANQQEVVKAARDIPAGSPLTRDRITTELVPQKFLPANPLLRQDIEIYLEMPVAENIKEGSMILTSDFAVAIEARTLSGRIPQGERAMSIPVDAISGISGLLRPGDRVDLLGTFPVGSKDDVIPEVGGNDSVGYVTMNLLQNVTLLAVGQEISDIAADNRQQRGAYSTVTMSLTPDESELLTIAQTRGKLQLLLRHRDDMETISVKRRTLREVLEQLDVLNTARVVRAAAPKGPKACAKGFRRGAGGECEPELEIFRGSKK